jgi:SpoVK/Ycf46/Vps4 family AAA+-type ATPase
MFEQALEKLVRARIPGVFVPTLEEDRVLKAVRAAIKNLLVQRVAAPEKVRLFRWSRVSGWVETLKKGDSPDMWVWDSVPWDRYDSDLTSTLRAFRSEEVGQGQWDFVSILDAGTELSGPENVVAVRMLREILAETRSDGVARTIILVGADFDLPETLRADCRVLPFEIPDTASLGEILGTRISALKNSYPEIVFDSTQIENFIRACLGLSAGEALHLLSLSIVTHRAFDDRAVELALKEKKALVKSSALEYRTPRLGMDDVAGLENVKEWIRGCDKLWKNRENAKKRGCSIPSGLLLIGIQGCGKSLTAEVLAGHWGLPLLVFDVGSLFGSLLGQTEGAFRKVKEILHACKPCVVFIDEIEKSFGGQGDLDGGTTGRVKASFLSWLQEKPEEIFVVASANDIGKFVESPEIIRAGRFDQIFFVDLPDEKARAEVLAIKFRQRGYRANDPVIKKCIAEGANVSAGYSPAELEACVKSVINRAFNEGVEVPRAAWLLEAIVRRVPLSRTMSEKLESLRGWVRDGRAEAASSAVIGQNGKPAERRSPKADGGGFPVLN